MDKAEVIAKCQLAVTEIVSKYSDPPQLGDPPYIAWEKLLTCVKAMDDKIEELIYLVPEDYL